MKTRLFVLVIVLALSLVLTTGSVQAGPPYPAIVIRMDEGCYQEWLNDEMQIVPLWMRVHSVEQKKSGIMNVSCQGKVDFDSPDYASVEEVCEGYPDWAIFCRGDGALAVHGLTCFGITSEGEFVLSKDSEILVTPGGISMISCKFELDE